MLQGVHHCRAQELVSSMQWFAYVLTRIIFLMANANIRNNKLPRLENTIGAGELFYGRSGLEDIEAIADYISPTFAGMLLSSLHAYYLIREGLSLNGPREEFFWRNLCQV